MAIIPLKQTITVKRPVELDRRGEPIGEPQIFTLKCRFVEETKLVKRYSSGTGANQTMSEEVVSSAQIFLDKYADIKYKDEIEYTNELGTSKKYSIINMEIKRNFGGKPILTVVYV